MVELTNAQNEVVELTNAQNARLAGTEQPNGPVWRLLSFLFSRRSFVMAAGSLGGLAALPSHAARLDHLDGEPSLTFKKGHNGWIGAIAISANGRFALTGGSDRSLNLWELKTGDMIWHVADDYKITSVSIAPNIRTALSASGNSLTLLDLGNGREIRTFSTRDRAVRAGIILPDGRRALSLQGTKALTLWDLAGGAIRTVESDTDIDAIAVAPDGRTALSANNNATFTVWDLASGTPVRKFPGEKDIGRIALAPDGQRALCAKENNLILWDVPSEHAVRTLAGHKDLVSSVAIAPDGRTAVSGSLDKTVKVWNLTTGSEVRSFSGHAEAISAVAIAPDGRTALSGSADGSLKLWDLS